MAAAAAADGAWPADAVELQPLSQAPCGWGAPTAVGGAAAGPERRTGRWRALAPLAAGACGLLAAGGAWGHRGAAAAGRGGRPPRISSLQRKFSAGGRSPFHAVPNGVVSLGNFFDDLVEEIYDEAVDLSVVDGDPSADEPPGKIADGDLEWIVKFDGSVRVRSSPSTDGDNVIGEKGPRGAIVIGGVEDGWLSLLYEPGYVKVEADGKALLAKRQVTYMTIPHGTCGQFMEIEAHDGHPQAGGMNNITDYFSCMAAGTSLGSAEAAAVTSDGVCAIEGPSGHRQTICSTGVYDAPTSGAEPPTPAPDPGLERSSRSSEMASSNTSANAATAAAADATTSLAPCEGCCPKAWDRPTIVIPVWERDICKLKVTAKSIVEHDKDGAFGKVIVMWISHRAAADFGSELGEIQGILEPHGEVEIVEVLIGEGVQGWMVQQAAKLKVASRVETDYYLVLDAKDTLLRDVTRATFFTACNQAKIFGRYEIKEGSMPSIQVDWYNGAAEVLGVTTMNKGLWPAPVPPITLHRPTVLNLLDRLGEPQDFGQCTSGLCDAFERGATEFSLYLVYVGRLAKMHCIHAIEERAWNNELAASIRHADDASGRKATAKVVKDIAEESKANGRVMFFGAQPGALDGFEGAERDGVVKDLFRIYDHAGLYHFRDREDLVDCVVGGGAGDERL